MGSSKIHPENDPFGEAAQSCIHSFWSGPQDCMKTLAPQFQSNSGWKGPLWWALELNLLPKAPRAGHSGVLNVPRHGDPTTSLGNSVSDQLHQRKVFLLSHPHFPRGVPGQLPGLEEQLWHSQVTGHKTSQKNTQKATTPHKEQGETGPRAKTWLHRSKEDVAEQFPHSSFDPEEPKGVFCAASAFQPEITRSQSLLPWKPSLSPQLDTKGVSQG